MTVDINEEDDDPAEMEWPGDLPESLLEQHADKGFHPWTGLQGWDGKAETHPYAGLEEPPKPPKPPRAPKPKFEKAMAWYSRRWVNRRTRRAFARKGRWDWCAEPFDPRHTYHYRQSWIRWRRRWDLREQAEKERHEGQTD